MSNTMSREVYDRPMSSSERRTHHREQRENVRRQVLAAADALLRDRPYRELSVEATMAETGLTRTAFYRHFDDVTDVVLRLLEDVGHELYAVAARWLERTAEDFPAATHDGLSGIVGFFERHGRLIRAISEAAVTDERIEVGYNSFVEAFIDMTARGFDELVESGQIDPLDARPLARALNLMNERYLLDQFGHDPPGCADVAVRTLEAVWLRAVGPLRSPSR
jgi:TetR/AcrR family transcriptional regulator, ethionamide resistance regulator